MVHVYTGGGGGGDFIVIGVLDCGIMYLRMYVRGLVSSCFLINFILMVNKKQIFINGVKMRFAHIASILTHLESKCFTHLESLFFSHLDCPLSHLGLIFFDLFTYRGIFTFEGPTCNELRVIWLIPHKILSVITRSTIIT